MKEPFVPKSTISELMPYPMRRELFRRIVGPKSTLYGYKGDNGRVVVKVPACDCLRP